MELGATLPGMTQLICDCEYAHGPHSARDVTLHRAAQRGTQGFTEGLADARVRWGQPVRQPRVHMVPLITDGFLCVPLWLLCVSLCKSIREQ